MINVTLQEQIIIQGLITSHFPEVEVRIFGSRYHGTTRPYSDLDIALVGKEKLDWLKLHRLREAFADSNLPYRVDVLDWHAISPTFQQVIAQGYVILDIPTPTITT